MTGYTKLFGSIIASTIWREPPTTCKVWITMLAAANKHGIVEASLPGLADLARVSIDEAKEAIATLSAPDEYSRTKDHEGRRIVECDGGWHVLNHQKYREKMGADERREYLRVKQQESRQRRKGVNNGSTGVNSGQSTSTPSTHAEADADAKATKGDSPPSTPLGSRPTTPTAIRLAGIFKRKLTTNWTDQEIKAFKKYARTLSEEDLAALETYYSDNWPPDRDKNILRHDLKTFLNNLPGEIDRAHNWAKNRNDKSTRGRDESRTGLKTDIAVKSL